MRVGAVDCGTNSIRLLISEVGAEGALTDVHREMRVVRLGEGVDATGRFADAAIERTRTALSDYVDMMVAQGVSAVRMVATSATRDAANREEFFAMTAELLGRVVPGSVAEVISGDEEARLSFTGAVGELDAAGGPFVVVDLGGGSTEFVLGDHGGVTAARSVNIGCVRLTERCLHSDPPTDAEIAAAQSVIAEAVAEATDVVPVQTARSWIGVAGTMTTLAALGQGLTEYDPERIHLSRIGIDELSEVCWRLVRMTRAERAALGPMHPGRVDVIGGGSLVTLASVELMRAGGVQELIVSEHDILDGIAMSLLGA
ncbi:Ppx/GppA phosphatase family protein [Jongsikchunia kroppenstedtii]|uniref:Ppx/GppA phosphatase family protein n=1 Tax=Jongsikchunia kroppenstedtii TaxID=1121721 RepID=UPI00035F8FA9|nr:Ppx/GppA phosphatase family protein [Jongsikchunia kroppenstedtii]